MIAVVTCFFNFVGFSRPEANLHRFVRQMKREGVPVFGVEVVAPGGKPVSQIYKGWKWVHAGERQRLWQKEAALNLAEKMVPPEFDSIAWVDSDLWFSNPAWAAESDRLLHSGKDVLQLFSRARWTGPRGDVETSRASCISVPFDSSWKSHPGFAWAMRRELWVAAGGLYPRAISGGGDSIMSCAFTNSPIWGGIANHLGTNPAAFDKWAAHFKGVSVGEVPGEVFHEWHGSLKDRDYAGRSQRIASFDLTSIVDVAPNGLLQWNPAAPRDLINETALSFQKRREDGPSKD